VVLGRGVGEVEVAGRSGIGIWAGSGGWCSCGKAGKCHGFHPLAALEA
jgi:hypothetical protein